MASASRTLRSLLLECSSGLVQPRKPSFVNVRIAACSKSLPSSDGIVFPRSHRSAASTVVAPVSDGTSTLKFDVGADMAARGRREGPLALYQGLVASGKLREDDKQQRVLEILNAIFHGAASRQSRGLYLYGGVGCGKTMAMDLFFSSMQSAGLRVMRRHFHDFLNETHVGLHKLKTDTSNSAKARSPVERYALQLAGRVDVLCFDEFAITTIQDCVLLMPLFANLFQSGVTVVATSNRAPEDLYTDGLNRHLYLPPFLETLRVNCKIHNLISTTDYRRVHYENSPNAGVFSWPPDRTFVDRWFEFAAGSTGRHGILDLSYGRSIDVFQLSPCGQVARFSFSQICRSYLSADDYLYLARQVHTLLIDDVPKLTVDDHNEARRFTLLVDCCYEHHVRLICSMMGSPKDILGDLSQLRGMTLSKIGGEATAGCGDGDTAPSSSGVLEAVRRIKESMHERARKESASNQDSEGDMPERTSHSALDAGATLKVLSAEISRAKLHGDGEDLAAWRQDDDSDNKAPLHVSKAWDDRRRITAFTWESADPTAEQQTIKGVFAAAVASLQESGFAIDRAISRLQEMQTEAFLEQHKVKHGIS